MVFCFVILTLVLIGAVLPINITVGRGVLASSTVSSPCQTFSVSIPPPAGITMYIDGVERSTNTYFTPNATSLNYLFGNFSDSAELTLNFDIDITFGA